MPEAVAPLLTKVPLSAVEVLKKAVSPLPCEKLAAAEPLLVKMEVPAAALLVKDICPKLPVPSTAVTKFCVIPELFVMPTPIMVSVNPGPAVMV